MGQNVIVLERIDLIFFDDNFLLAFSLINTFIHWLTLVEENFFPINSDNFFVNTYSGLQRNSTFWPFPLWIRHFHKAQKQPKSNLKSPFFFRTAYISVKSISMSFGTKTIAQIIVRSHQTFNFHFAILKWAF